MEWTPVFILIGYLFCGIYGIYVLISVVRDGIQAHWTWRRWIFGQNFHPSILFYLVLVLAIFLLCCFVWTERVRAKKERESEKKRDLKEILKNVKPVLNCDGCLFPPDSRDQKPIKIEKEDFECNGYFVDIRKPKKLKGGVKKKEE